MSDNQLTNSLINQLTHNNEYPASKIGKLINKFTNSPINFLNRARKYNIFMQNEPNFKNTELIVTTCNINSYGIFRHLFRPKNEPKRTQNEPNFSPKLALFFPKLALNPCQSACPSEPEGRSRVKSVSKISVDSVCSVAKKIYKSILLSCLKFRRIKLYQHINGGFGEVTFLGVVNIIGGIVVNILILAGIGPALICIVRETALRIVEAVLLRRAFLKGLLFERVLLGIVGEDDFNPLYINPGVCKVLDYLRQGLLDFKPGLNFRYEQSACNLA